LGATGRSRRPPYLPMTAVYRFGRLEMRPAARQVMVDNQPAHLGSRAFDVLLALIERRERIVPKDELLDVVWPGLVVEENNLQVQISALRKLLGANAIATIPGRGYRFTLEATHVNPELDTSKERPTNNLPRQATSFVGRQRELNDVRELLTQNRLVTLVGAGGIGKTRLSLHVAAHVLDAYPEGVWLVELGSIIDPLLVPLAVAQILGIDERSSIPLSDTLCGQLKSRKVLLVLDNCEHLIEACATLVDALIKRTAEVRILATSREPLQVNGEQVMPLLPLSLPNRLSSVEEWARAESVQLFVERARLQLPGFVLLAHQAAAVAELCVRLDGIPLAVELAAARVRSLSVTEISARLVDRFRLLVEGARGAPPRQQTLRATLDWSYGLLAEPKRIVLRRLAVFMGDFRLDSACSIASDETINEDGVVDIVAQLVTRSLVVADTSSAVVRFRLLETTRVYALEKLQEAGESDRIKRRHALHFCDWFDRASDDWLAMTDADWRARYLPERDNVRAALEWALSEGGDSAIGIALAGAAGAVLLGFEDRQWMETAIERIDPGTPSSDQARLWLWHGVARTSSPAMASAAFAKAIALYRQIDDVSGLGHALSRQGGRLAFMGRFEQAAKVLEEAFPVLERTRRPKALASYFEGLGFLRMLAGDAAEGRRSIEKALLLYRRAGAPRNALNMLSMLAESAWALGDLDAALAGFLEVIPQLRALWPQPRNMLGAQLLYLAGVQTERGELDAALATAREGLPLLTGEGNAWPMLDHVALRAAAAGMTENAARIAGFVDSANAANETTRQPNEARARDRLQKLLRENLTPDAIEHLFAEGASMTEDEACRLALEG
jgi:predicted ATPase